MTTTKTDPAETFLVLWAAIDEVCKNGLDQLFSKNDLKEILSPYLTPIGEYRDARSGSFLLETPLVYLMTDLFVAEPPNKTISHLQKLREATNQVRTLQEWRETLRVFVRPTIRAVHIAKK